MSSGRVLVIYSFGEVLRRATNRDHLYAFARHSRLEPTYVNLTLRGLSRRLRAVDWDLVVLHTSVLAGLRWPPSPSRILLRRLRAVEDLRGVRVALPQDDFLRSAPVDGMLSRLRVDHVFTPVPPSEWPKVYPTAREHAQLHLGLTGYLEDDEVERMERITSEEGDRRPIDVGYRAWHAPPWLGRHGALKTEIARLFAERGPEHGLKVNISTRDGDAHFGDDWTRFMAHSKYTIGVEGGASILDHDGSVRAATERYLADHPDASFDEVEAACFPGRDGELDLRALSPRHLEACVTRTCQVLIEGDYNGALVAGRHYLPLAADFSNLDEVLYEMRRDERRAEIVEAAHRDVVQTGAWTYASYVRRIEDVALGDRVPVSRPAAGRAQRRAERVDAASWQVVALREDVVVPVWLWLLRRGPVQALAQAARRRGMIT